MFITQLVKRKEKQPKLALDGLLANDQGSWMKSIYKSTAFQVFNILCMNAYARVCMCVFILWTQKSTQIWLECLHVHVYSGKCVYSYKPANTWLSLSRPRSFTDAEPSRLSIFSSAASSMLPPDLCSQKKQTRDVCRRTTRNDNVRKPTKPQPYTKIDRD